MLVTYFRRRAFLCAEFLFTRQCFNCFVHFSLCDGLFHCGHLKIKNDSLTHFPLNIPLYHHIQNFEQQYQHVRRVWYYVLHRAYMFLGQCNFSPKNILLWSCDLKIRTPLLVTEKTNWNKMAAGWIHKVGEWSFFALFMIYRLSSGIFRIF